MQASEPITLALHDLANGDASALDRVMPMVYSELRNLAGYYLRQERKEHTLQPTALVHEAYFRLVGGMTAEESAEVLNLPVQKVRAELRIAQAWLKRELDNSSSPKNTP